jgi:hypothetical protein
VRSAWDVPSAVAATGRGCISGVSTEQAESVAASATLMKEVERIFVAEPFSIVGPPAIAGAAINMH